jgi:hypothetical protein
MEEPRMYMYQALMVMLWVSAPTTVTLTAQETIRINHQVPSPERILTAARYGKVIRPGTTEIRLVKGTYQFQTLRDVSLHVPDASAVTVTAEPYTSKCVDPPPLAAHDVTFAIRGDADPEMVPTLTVTYGDGN